MESVELWLACVLAFTMVFVLLTVLAISMRMITAVWPHKTVGIDAATVAAISSAVLSASPNTQITTITETK